MKPFELLIVFFKKPINKQLVRLSSKSLSPATSAFIQHIQLIRNQIISDHFEWTQH